MSSTDVLDKQVFLKLRDLNPDDAFIKNILDMYYESVQSHLNLIMGALELNDYETIKRITHMLKSSSFNVGAKAFGLLCKSIESKIVKRDIDDLKKYCLELEPVYQATKAAMDEVTSIIKQSEQNNE